MINQIVRFCDAYQVPLTSARAILLVLAAIHLLGAVLFFAVERPFLQLRRRVTVKSPRQA